MVKIRLKRMGAKKRPFYRLVVADSRSPRDGRFIELLGFYDPLPNPAKVQIDADKVREWIGKGARPSDAARALLVEQGILAKVPRVFKPAPGAQGAAGRVGDARGSRGGRRGARRGRGAAGHRRRPRLRTAGDEADAGGGARAVSDYADLTRFITEHIVSNKQAINVHSVPRGRTTIIEVSVAEEDMGKVIGKGGRNIEAIRAVVRAAGLRKHERVQVELADGGRHA